MSTSAANYIHVSQPLGNGDHTGSVIYFLVLSPSSQALQPLFKTREANWEDKCHVHYVLMASTYAHSHSIHVHNTYEWQTMIQMPRDRANWDDHTTPVLLELVAKQKELCHWGDKGPTTIGWTNIYRSFNESTKLGYHKKQIQNKFSDLKRAYFNWRDGFKQSGLGRDPEPGEVAVDPVWYAARHGVLTSTFSFNPLYYGRSH